ncbi:MAG: hypothetical protein E7425_00510 [Ruminococcaceae bacterium]|jgi:predicted thioesterase|nr:hypothetical protein [Oscillospiraceae bacterium]
MQVGESQEVKLVVTEADTAEALGSGGLRVLATPRLIALMENAAYAYLQKELPEGKSSVGVKVDVEHVSPTPVGMEVRVTAEVASVSENGKQVCFKVRGYDDAGLIAEGLHRRVIIDVERFLAKCQNKQNQ